MEGESESGTQLETLEKVLNRISLLSYSVFI